MKRKLNNSQRVAATPSVESIDDSLHITRGEARQQAAKFRDYRDRLEHERDPAIGARHAPDGEKT